jgi:hypothetical protein
MSSISDGAQPAGDFRKPWPPSVNRLSRVLRDLLVLVQMFSGETATAGAHDQAEVLTPIETLTEDPSHCRRMLMIQRNRGKRAISRWNMGSR